MEREDRNSILYKHIHNVLVNKVIRDTIFGHVQSLHQCYSKFNNNSVGVSNGGNGSNSKLHRYKWSDLSVNPILQSRFGYIEQLKATLDLQESTIYNKYKWSNDDGNENRFVPNLNEMVESAIIGNHIDVIKMLHQRYPQYTDVLFYNLGKIAIKYSRLEIATYMYTNYPHTFVSNCTAVATLGSLETLKYCIDLNNSILQLHQLAKEKQNSVDNNNIIMTIPPTILTLGQLAVSASSLGNLEIIMYLDKMEYPFSTGVMDMAASRNHIDIVRYLNDNRTEGCTKDAMDSAIQNGNIEIVKYLNENRTEGYSINVFESSLQLYPDIFFYILNNGINNNQEQGVNNQGGLIGLNTFKCAAFSGCIDIIKYIVDSQPKDTIPEREEFNHMISSTLYYCTIHDDMIFQFIAQLSPPDQDFTISMENASRDGNLGIVEWIHNNKKVVKTSKNRSMMCAARYGHLDIVRFLYKNQYSTTKHFKDRNSNNALDSAAESTHLKTVKYLVKIARLEIKSITITNAIKSGSVPVLKYLLKHNNNQIQEFWIEMGDLDGIVLSNHFEMLVYLTENHPHISHKWSKDILNRLVVKQGSFNLFKYLVTYRSHDATYIPHLMDDLLYFNRSEPSHLMEYILFINDHCPNQPCSLKSLFSATNRSLYDIVRFLYYNRHKIVVSLEEGIKEQQQLEKSPYNQSIISQLTKSVTTKPHIYNFFNSNGISFNNK